jgi:hypothetical protein
MQYVNIGGTIKPVREAFVNIGGTLKRVTDGFVNIGGTLKRTYQYRTASFDVAASSDDGMVALSGLTYPPVTDNDINTTDNNFVTIREYQSPSTQYDIGNGLVRFDTSSIPDGAIVVKAQIRFYVALALNANSRNLTADWHNFDTISTADYSETALNDALIGKPISELSAGNTYTLDLINSTYVNNTGYTGLRFHISGGEATSLNQVWMRAKDAGTTDYCQLNVSYVV